MATCKACGDKFTPVVREHEYLLAEHAKARKLLTFTHCDECALEKAAGVVRPGTTMHGTGGGRRVVRDAMGLGG